MIRTDGLYYRKASLISVCYDRRAHLAAAWPSWRAQTYPRIEHVVVVGYDESAAGVADDRDFRGRVVVVRGCASYRGCYLHNLGAKWSTGEYLCFVDADVTLRDAWVAYCVGRLARAYDIVVHKNTMKLSNDAGGSSGTYAISRWLFEKIRGYNENLDGSWGYDDTDVFIRAQRAGGRLTVYPASMAQAASHDDAVRSKHFSTPLPPRHARTFLAKMRICDLDEQVHRFEANRVRRLTFPSPSVSVIERDGFSPAEGLRD